MHQEDTHDKTDFSPFQPFSSTRAVGLHKDFYTPSWSNLRPSVSRVFAAGRRGEREKCDAIKKLGMPEIWRNATLFSFFEKMRQLGWRKASKFWHFRHGALLKNGHVGTPETFM